MDEFLEWAIENKVTFKVSRFQGHPILEAHKGRIGARAELGEAFDLGAFKYLIYCVKSGVEYHANP